MEVGREGIEPSWVAPGDFKSPASTISPPPQASIGSVCMILTCLSLFVNHYTQNQAQPFMFTLLSRQALSEAS